MEEKERCIIGKGEDIFIADNDRKVIFTITTKKLQDLLNQQSNRIKELESKLRVSNSLNASFSLDYNESKKQYDSQEKLLTRILAENSRLTLENQQLKEENGYIIFVDGYDENGNEVHKQEFVKYKDKFNELLKENQQLKQSQKQIAIYDKATKKDCFNDIKEITSYLLNFDVFYNDYRTLDSLEKDGQRIQHIAQRLKELGGGENECEN